MIRLLKRIHSPVKHNVRYSVFVVMMIAASLIFSVSCGEQDPATSKAPWAAADCSEITAENADDCIRMNQVQAIGTHNSYKLAPTPELVSIGNEAIPGWSRDIEYEHRPLDYQLQHLNVRQIELDIFADPEGGLYAGPSGAQLAGDEEFIRPEGMLEPGFKVLHVQDVDYRSSCLTFKSCLTHIRDWSLENPSHLPVLVMVEMKDGSRESWGGIEFTVPIEIGPDLLDEVDAEIWDIFEKKHVIIPDEIRGGFDTLEEAVLTRGWPTLAQAKGRVMFAMDNTGRHRDDYLQRTPNLEARAMFVSSEPGEPTAAFIKMNNAIDGLEAIRERIADGYVIRTRSDIPVVEARTGNTYRKERALQSGAQYISTDYPEPAPFETGYMVTLPDTDSAGRCNPVNAPQGCQDSYIRE